MIKSPFGIPSEAVTPRNVVKATCMMEDAHVAGRRRLAGWPSGPNSFICIDLSGK